MIPYFRRGGLAQMAGGGLVTGASQLLDYLARYPSGAIKTEGLGTRALQAIKNLVQSDPSLVLRGVVGEDIPARSNNSPAAFATRHIPTALEFAGSADAGTKGGLHVLRLPRAAAEYPLVNTQATKWGRLSDADPDDFMRELLNSPLGQMLYDNDIDPRHTKRIQELIDSGIVKFAYPSEVGHGKLQWAVSNRMLQEP